LRLLGVIRTEAGDHAASADLFARVTELSPGDADAHYNLGTSLLALGRPEEAVAHLRRAMTLAPQHAKALNNLGSALRALRRLDEAEEIARRATEVAPELPTAWNNLGIVHADQGRPADAVVCFRRAVTIKPDFADAWFNLGKALQSRGRREEALAQFRHAIELRDDYAQARLGEAFLLLVMGDFAQGLPRLEWRWRLPEKSPRPFTQPLWRGENLGGKTILLHAEQGFGDSLMLLRYAPLVAARGGRVIIEVPRALERLAARLAGGPYTIVAGSQPLPAFDTYCPLMSLPLAFGTTPDTIPAAVPYFTAAPDAVARWRPNHATPARK
jgi:Flp pilus assembly protein TadD